MNFSPAFIWVLSGTVTSRSNTALSLQFAGEVTASVDRVVAAGDGVKVAGTNPDFVGGKVAVTKPDSSGVGVIESGLMEMQDERKHVIRNT